MFPGDKGEISMIEGQFDIIFRGQIVKQFELEEVKKNLVALFKSSPEAIEKLFTGNEVTIRKGIDYADAMKYQSALKKAGALALIKEITNVSAGESTSSEVCEQKNETKKVDKMESEASVSVVDDSLTDNAEDNEPQEDEGNLTVAKAGAQILPPRKYEKREVDTSELSLAEAGERILPPKAPEKYKQPSIDHLSLE